MLDRIFKRSSEHNLDKRVAAAGVWMDKVTLLESDLNENNKTPELERFLGSPELEGVFPRNIGDELRYAMAIASAGARICYARVSYHHAGNDEQRRFFQDKIDEARLTFFQINSQVGLDNDVKQRLAEMVTRDHFARAVTLAFEEHGYCRT